MTFGEGFKKLEGYWLRTWSRAYEKEIECRHFGLTTILAFQAYHEKAVACAKVKECKFEDPSTEGKPSFILLLEKVRANTIEKSEIEDREKSNVMPVYGLSRPSILRNQGWRSTIFLLESNPRI